MGTSISRLAVVVVFLMAPPGCSWLMVESPPAADPLPGQQIQCTDSNYIPAADFVGAGVSAFAGFVTLTFALFLAVQQEDAAAPVAYAGLAGFGAGGLFLWSGIDGAIDTSRCRELRMRRIGPIPQPQPGPPQGPIR
jgi:hypothetical protein